MALTTVTNTTIVAAAEYNAIQASVVDVISGYYGASLTSLQSTTVTPGADIVIADWDKLYADISRGTAHQLNQQPPAAISTNTLTANFVNAIITSTNFVMANTGTLHDPAQMTTATIARGARDSFRSAQWGSTLTHTVNYVWGDDVTGDQLALNFFRLGGRLSLQTGYTTGSGDDRYSVAWARNIDWMNAQLQLVTNQYTLNNYLIPGQYGDFSLSTASGILYPPNGQDYDIMTVSMNRTSLRSIQANIELGHRGTNVDLDVASTATYYYSRGDATPVGIAAPEPVLTNITNLGDAGEFVPYPTKVLILKYAIVGFTWNALDSSTQTITLGNTGNTALTITDITYTNNGGITATPDYAGFGTFPVVIAPGAVSVFHLTCSGTAVGTWQNAFTVSSDNDTGPFTVNFSQVVSPAIFKISVSPTTWSATSNSIADVSQTFSITPRGQTLASSVATISGSAAFTFLGDAQSIAVPAASDMPVVFNTRGLASGTYDATLSVTSTAVNAATSSTTAAMRVVYTQPANQNIGNWISAMGITNSVVGMSYDFIGGVRYLTLGIGGAGDLIPGTAVMAPELMVGGIPYMDIANLGINADTKYSSGPVLYKGPADSDYCQFLKDFGIWVNPMPNWPPNDVTVSRTHTITVPTTGNYNWSLAIDDTGWFDIDGTLVGDVRNEKYHFQVEHTGVTRLTAGNHTLTWHAVNTGRSRSGNPGSVGIRLKRASDGLVIWSTLNPVRATPAYRYWKEVYRIPLTLGKHTYRSKDYYIKYHSANIFTMYGSYFGSDGSFFTATDDGFGNISIAFQSLRPLFGINPTLYSLQDVPYYYSARYTRYRQLEGPIGNQTHYFLGFNRLGAVRTSLLSYPR